MIGIDSNILLRLALQDDEPQCRRIDALLQTSGAAPGSVRISDMVLCETVWTLSRAFRRRSDDLAAFVVGLLAEPSFAFRDRDAVITALRLFRAGKAGFADCLIAVENSRAGCEWTATFDADAWAMEGICPVP